MPFGRGGDIASPQEVPANDLQGGVRDMHVQSPWYQEGRWFVSPYMWESEVQATLTQRPARVKIADATLREAEDVPGVILTQTDRARLAEELAALGVAEVDVGFVGYATMGHHADGLRAIREAGIVTPLTCTLQIKSSNKPR